jgi:hypothetical protein
LWQGLWQLLLPSSGPSMFISKQQQQQQQQQGLAGVSGSGNLCTWENVAGGGNVKRSVACS